MVAAMGTAVAMMVEATTDTGSLVVSADRKMANMATAAVEDFDKRVVGRLTHKLTGRVVCTHRLGVAETWHSHSYRNMAGVVAVSTEAEVAWRAHLR